MTTAAGILSAPLVALRSIIAATAAFQTLTGTADATAAAALVHLLETPRSQAPTFAIVDFGDLIRDRQSLNSARFNHRDGSTLTAYFRSAADNADSETAMIDFANAIGAIWSQIELAAGSYVNSTLAVTSIELLIAPTRIVHEKRDRAGDYFEAAIGLTYSRQP